MLEKKEGYYSKIKRDDRINAYSLGLYLSILEIWRINEYRNPFQTNRRELMIYSRSGSIVTYHKYIKVLVDLGYIEYSPSYHPAIGSLIRLK
jgi:hypothetical protein